MSHPVKRFQILSDNPTDAGKFYSAVFGWTVSTDASHDYHGIDTGSQQGIQGGISRCEPNSRASVKLFVEVENVNKAVASAYQLGGNVIVAPHVLPNGYEMAVVQDPEGIQFGAMNSRPHRTRRPLPTT